MSSVCWLPSVSMEVHVPAKDPPPAASAEVAGMSSAAAAATTAQVLRTDLGCVPESMVVAFLASPSRRPDMVALARREWQWPVRATACAEMESVSSSPVLTGDGSVPDRLPPPPGVRAALERREAGADDPAL